MEEHGLVRRQLLPDSAFNWVYPVDLVVGLVVTLFFLFYFNRVFGNLIAYAIRKYTWYKFHVYIDFQALQFSFLAGRVFFKGFRYHGHNETILINDGYITWRYWLRRVREVECVSSQKHKTQTKSGAGLESALEENVEKKTSDGLPCRIKAKVRGVEWFIYNRSPAYDSILENLVGKQASDSNSNDNPVRKRARLNKTNLTAKERPHECDGSHTESSWSFTSKHGSEKKFQSRHDSEPSSVASRVNSRPQSGTPGTGATDDLPLFLQILPIKLECSKGAVVMGNQHTRSVLTAKFDSALGRVDSQKPSHSLDKYKQVIDLDFTHPVVQFKANRAYEESQRAEKPEHNPETNVSHDAVREQESHRHKRSLWSSLLRALHRLGGSETSFTHNRVAKNKVSPNSEGVPGEQRWLGLTRYMDDEDDLIEQERWKAVEYGRFETIVDSPSIAINVHWDTPGAVPKRAPTLSKDRLDGDINGDDPPDWSIDLRIRGGEIHYGPWADKQRIDLQSAFFPTLYKNAVPASIIRPGDPRISTIFKLLIEVEVATKFVLPTREESKDWRWKGHPTGGTTRDAKFKAKKFRGKKKEKANLSPEIRPYGWLDFQVMPDSTVNFTMDLVARPNGYRNRVELDLRGPEMASSVNHEVLWRSKSQIISCDLSNPLEWNKLRQWYINIKGDALEVFLLRDHIFLLTDLINDWTSGPPGNYYTFTPFKYLINLQLTNFKLYVNANDSNIINNPTDVNDNTFVIVWGEHLNADLTIPIQHYQPSRNAILFDVDARDGGFELRTPQWNTQHAFLKGSQVASLNDLKINGSYNYATSTSPTLTDILLMEVYGDSPKIYLYGFIIRYLMKIKDNYFGEDLHFRTLEEYKAQVAIAEQNGHEATEINQHSKVSNDLDVILKVSADHASAVLPSGLYTAGQGIALDIASICGDLRFTNYYMDLAVAFSPISVGHTCTATSQDPAVSSEADTQVFIGGLNLYGHRLFGLPPAEPTYVCNWDFDVGSIHGQCTPQFLHSLLLGVRCFGFSFDDAENALPPLNPPVIHDVTFLRVRVQPVMVWLRAELAAFRLSMQSVKLNYNDWGGGQFSDKLDLEISEMVVAIVDAQDLSMAAVHKTLKGSTQAYLQMTVSLRIFSRKEDLEKSRHLQQSHIKLQDVRTHRTPWLLRDFEQPSLQAPPTHHPKIRPPAMQFPQMPEPLNHDCDLSSTSSTSYSTSSISTHDDMASKISSRKSSFLMDRPRHTGDSANAAQLRCADQNITSPTNAYGPPPAQANTVSGRQRGSLAQAGIPSPGPYKTPYFQLQDIALDLQDVPMPTGHAKMQDPAGLASEDPLVSQLQDHSIAKSSVMIDLTPDLRALCTPLALRHTLNLLAELRLDSVDTLLDALQVDTVVEPSKSSQASHKQSANLLEFNIRIPCLEARFLSKSTQSSLTFPKYAGLCVGMENINVSARLSKESPSKRPESPKALSSIHASLEKVDLALLSKLSDSADVDRLVGCTVSDAIFWAAKSETFSASFIFKTADLVAANQGISDALPSAFESIAEIMEIAKSNLQMVESKKLQLQLLVLSVTVAGEAVPDPPFLTRASYVLRSANNHLRSSGSWKLMARLRYIFQSLPKAMQAEIMDQCIARPKACPKDAKARVASCLEHWRAWDAFHVSESLLMQKVYGPFDTPKDGADIAPQMKATVQGERVQFIVFAGQSQNTALVEKLDAAILLNYPAVASGGFIDPETFSTGDTVLQAHCAKITTSLEWDLCDLVNTALEIPFDRLPSKPQKTLHTSAPTKNSKFHLVVSSSGSVINFKSVNLSTTLLCQGLQASTVVSQLETRQAINFLISAEMVMSEVQSHSRPLTISKLQRPNVFCSTDNVTKTANKDPFWKIAASCSSVSFKVLEDPLLLIEVIDNILQDEIAHVMKVAHNVQTRISQNQDESPAHVNPGANRAHVTLCFDAYLLSLTILPSLIYRISGGRARTTVQHGVREVSQTLIDFDFSQHMHAFNTKNNRGSEEIAAVHIPPINGRLELGLGRQEKSITINTMIEAMTLEASALHALLVTFSRPEISNLFTSVDREVRSTQKIYQQIFGVANSSDQEAHSEAPIFYDASVFAAGLSVRASSPLSSVSAREGQLNINLGFVQAKASNRAGNHGPALVFPEFEVRLDRIQVVLIRIDSANRIGSGEVAVSASLRSTSKASRNGEMIRAFQLQSNEFNVNMYAETVPIVIDIIGHLQTTLKKIDLASELKSLRSIRRPRVRSAVGTPLTERDDRTDGNERKSQSLFGAMYSLEMTNIRVAWIIGPSTPMSPGREAEDLVLSFSKIDLSTKKDNAARLLIENLQLQMVPISKAIMGRSQNSALLPEMVFNVAYLSTGKDRRLAFQAAGKSLDLRLTSKFILPVSDLRRSFASALQDVRTATADWKASAAEKGNQTRRFLGGKKFASILIDADFAGAVVYVEGRTVSDRQTLASITQDGGRAPQHGRYNQFTPDNAGSNTTLRSPGLAFKIEYRNGGIDQESLNAEIKVDGSSNVLHPTVVPLVKEISSSVKEMMGESEQLEQSSKSQPEPPKPIEEDRLRSADPSAIFGKTRVSFGLKICKQEFSLSCQPMAKVAATARFEDIYVTLNTIQSSDHGQFFTVSAVFMKPEIAVQHAYSRESTARLSVDSAVISLMSSKHVSAANGLSVILKISPMNVQINARQLQDVLLFREIWIPAEIRRSTAAPAPSASTEPQAFIVQRYQQVASAGTFPWNATVSIAQLNIQLDLGQSLGRSAFNITNFWVSSKKTSDWEQNLCLGFDRAGMDATGRMSGLIELQGFRIRTSIQWPMEDAKYRTPLVQASLGFDRLRVKAAFDYQAFAIMNIAAVNFMMYNVRDIHQTTGDRLVAVVESDSVQVFCTAIGASQSVALYQAVERLMAEKRAAYELSLKDIERFLRRRSTINPTVLQQTTVTPPSNRDDSIKVPIRLQTDVVVKLQAVSFGVLPSTFFDNQIFKVEARDTSARFSVALDNGKIHSTLEMSLGQLRVALSGVARPSTPKRLGEVSIDEVAASVTASRGGLILGVPKTLVTMQIWQTPESNHIDYIFKSSFQGNIDVGWNYSRISFIRGMHDSHVRALAQRLGKPLPQSAVQITGGPKGDSDDSGKERPEGEQEKITAVVNVQPSKYDYTALEPALVDTPQLRNLGEATPPLEWIGLNRERLPNLTHQIVIVSLLEVAKEVEDAYTKILGSS